MAMNPLSTSSWGNSSASTFNPWMFNALGLGGQKAFTSLSQTQMMTDAMKGMLGGALGGGTAGSYPMPSMEGMDPHQQALAQAKYLHNQRAAMSAAQQPQQAAGTDAGGMANVDTGISANPVYNASDIQKQINQIRAGYEVNPAFAQKGATFPGVGTSAGSLSAAMPGLIQGQMGAENDVQNLILGARQANLANILQGQQLQSQMGLGMAGNQMNRLGIDLGYNRDMQGIGLGYQGLDQNMKYAGINALLGAMNWG